MEMPSWLNEVFMERVLRHSENDDSIQVTETKTKPATNKGDNYLSDMYRVSVNFNRDLNGKTIEEKRSIIVKVAPTTDGTHKDLIEQAGLFDIEIKMMTTTLKEMQLIIEDTKLSGTCLFTQKKNPPILVIEDLASLGFRMADRQTGLDLQHCMLAIRGLAKFHASSVAICERKPEYKDAYNKGLINSDGPPEIRRFYISGMKSLARAVASWSELDQTFSEKLMQISDVICSRVADCKKRNDNEFNVINHGDFWVNNILFKYDCNGQVIDHTFVDFQLCIHGSPSIDLNYFLNTSPCEAVLIKYKNDIIEEYLKVLTSTMRKLKCKTHPPNLANLKNALHKSEIYGFLSACVILPILLVDKTQALNLGEMIDQDDATFNNKAYENEAYRKIMVRRLIQWNDMGLLDL